MTIPIHFVHIGLTCNDPLAIERFYTEHFGFKRTRVVPLGQEQIVFIKSGYYYLELFQAKEASPLPTPQNDGYSFAGLRHLAFEVDSVEAKLAELGDAVKIMLGPADFGDFIPGWKGVWVADPEGNIVEISQGYVDQDSPPPLT
jgi:glyoxylase I family protein